MPDGERAKPLICIWKAVHKVSKTLKGSEDLDLTYPQAPRNSWCPASVAIALVDLSICRFVF